MTAVMLSHDLPLAETHTLTGTPTQGTFGIPNASVITPGDPFRSVLFYRLATVGSGRMPRLGSRAVDDRALSLFQEWIATLPSPTATTKAPLPANTDVVDVDRLLQSTSGALRLARALDAGTVPSNLRTLAVAKGVAHEHPEVRGLFERYVPEDRRLPRLGENLDPRPVLALAGKPDHGREIFFASGSACSSCHRIGGKGGTLGPDLSHIGTKYKHDKILESVLEPSKAIDATYLWYVIETKDGQTIAGKMVDQNDQSVALVDASGVPVRVPTANVKQLVAQEKSPMPELLLAAMTAQEAADLIAFLASLK